MDLFVLNRDLDVISIVDTYKSIIWTDRYQESGDFELYLAADPNILNSLKVDNYIWIQTSEHVMIIEGIKIESSAEDGDYATITGRSLESILDRRVVWGLKNITGNLQTGIQTLLNENIISPSKPERKIDNFIFEASTDPAITELTIDTQYTGDNIYELLNGICVERGIGFKVTLNDNKQFVFKLYAGVDRSYAQFANPYVIFSPDFDNIIDSNYSEDKSGLKNVTLVGGEGEGTERRYTGVGDISGLDRREIFTDARDVSSEDDDGNPITDDEYIALLRQRGKETLAENKYTASFEGQAETTVMFKYGEDFFQGDIVQVADAYGHETKARVLEVITSEDEEGFSVYPTFSMVEDEDTMLLPDGYEALEYIQSSGTQWIDTTYKPSNNTSIKMDMQFVTLSTNAQSPFGVRSSASSSDANAYIAFVTGGTIFRSDYFGSSTSGTPTNIMSRTTIDRSKNVCKAWDLTLTNTANTGTSGITIYLFAANNAGTAAYNVSIRLYSCLIYENETLVRNFVPVKSDTGALGLYDLVNRVFYGNSGTGTFTTEEGV